MILKRILALLIGYCSLCYASTTYTDIYDFAGGTGDGSSPQGSLFQASNGLVYGMTSNGGTSGLGIIFSFSPTTPLTNYTVLHNFGAGTDGQVPNGSLIQASNGLIYGMTSAGGTHMNHGMIFSYDPTTTTYTDVHDFGTGMDGQTPNGSLFQASNGLLYGMTEFGGTHMNHGMIFSYDPTNMTYTPIYNFGSISNDGSNPFGSLIQASNGLLYGMTNTGGTSGNGVIFSYNPTSTAYAIVHNFAGMPNDGADPVGSLFLATNGLIYGVTQAGGTNNNGIIFSFDPANVLPYTVIYSFGSSPNDGSSPQGSLSQASNGLIYGMTLQGGTTSQGTIFSFDPANASPGSTYTILQNFATTNGSFPVHGALFQASNTVLYGLTSEGGATSHGVIFSLVVPLTPPPPPPPPSSSSERAFERSSGPGGYRSR